MIEVSAEFDKQELQQFFNKVNAVDKEVRYQIVKGELPRKLSIKYSEAVKENLINQTFASTYKPYNQKYADWKQKHGGRIGGFWQLSGKLFMSIKGGFRVADGFFGGIPFGSMGEPGMNYGLNGPAKPIVMYGKMMEYGSPNINHSGVHPKRPLFEPTFRKFVFSGSKQGAGNAWVISDEALKIVAGRWSGKWVP